VKWFAPERAYEKALKLRDMHIRGEVRLRAPEMILYEVANALRFHRVYKFSVENIIEAVKSVKDLDIVYECDMEVWRIAIELSFKIGISVYDAIYAALSVSRKAPLVTSDRELHNKLKGQISIILLEEL